MALRTACGQRSCIKAFDGFLLRFARSCKQKRTELADNEVVSKPLMAFYFASLVAVNRSEQSLRTTKLY
ncbi:hypothetical protein, partial [Campylobacter geochelonis]